MEGNENWIAARRVKDHLQPEGSWQDLQRRVRVIESFRFNSHLSLLVTDKFSTTCTAAALRSWVNTITSELLLDHGAQPQVVHMYVCLARSPHDGLVRSADRWAAKSLCKRKRLLMSSSVRNHKQLSWTMMMWCPLSGIPTTRNCLAARNLFLLCCCGRCCCCRCLCS